MKDMNSKNMNSKNIRCLFRVVFALTVFPLMATIAGCPKPAEPTKKPKPRVKRDMTFPWRLWSRRVDGLIHVVKTTKRRIVAVEYGELPGGRLEPISVVGLEADSGQERWRRPLKPKLLDPSQPWKVQMALKDRVLVIWLSDNSLLGIDLYTGNNFWKEPRPNSMGVKSVGFGFVTAWKEKVFFLKPATGEVMNTFEIPEEVTAPLVISAEGEAVLPCGPKLVGLNLNSGKVTWTHEMNLENGKLPAKEPWISEERIILAHDMVNQIVKTNVARLDGESLKPKWTRKIKGRVRTHNAVWKGADELQFLLQKTGGGERWYRINPSNGEIKGTLPGRDRANCVKGKMRLYCPYSRKGTHGIEALDLETLKSEWTWDTLGDRSKNQHKFINDVLYVADGQNVLGLDESGKTVFKSRIIIPGMNLQANRILGAHKGVLVITVVDWGEIGETGKGEIWGIDMKTSRRRWRIRLPGTLYTTDAVRLLNGLVYYMDHRKIHYVRANTGRVLGSWFHKMDGKPAAPPKLHSLDGLLYAVRGKSLVVFNPKNIRPVWRKELEDGSRIVGHVMDLLIVRSLDKKIHAHEIKKGEELWSKPWPEPADPELLDLSKSAAKGLLLAGKEKSMIVDPKTGEKTQDWGGVRHIMRLEDGDVMAVGVQRRVPEEKNIFVALGIRRKSEATELVELWRFALPRQKSETPEGEDKGGYWWWKATPTHLLFKEKETGCLKAIDMDEGKEAWKSCEPEWQVPPLFYKGYLYSGSGSFRPTESMDIQGLLKTDVNTGKNEALLKIPGPETMPNRFMVNSPAPIKNGVLYLLTHGPRLRAVKVGK